MSSSDQLVEHFFRHESANLIAVLTRVFGFELIDVVEDKVQEALLEALRSWRQCGVPKNPAGWLHRVAKNRIIDTLRKERRKQLFDDTAEGLGESRHPGLVSELLAVSTPVPLEPDECEDSLLRMIFACCHPDLEPQTQLALTLKVVCGFGDHEVGRGLFLSPAAVKKRVTRAKQFLRMRRTTLEYPSVQEMPERLEMVQKILYLMFNEGHSATQGTQLLRIDLCEEAVRLCHLLCERRIGNHKTKALLALMLFHASRFDARLGPTGDAVLLAEQDRSRWDRDMIKVAEYWLAKSAGGDQVTHFHLEAGIARLHCNAKSLETTEWDSVIRLYDLLLELFPSPVYNLNKAIALWQFGKTDKAMEILRQLDLAGSLKSYPLLHCTVAKVQESLGSYDKAKNRLRQALGLVKSEHERELIRTRIKYLSSLSPKTAD